MELDIYIGTVISHSYNPGYIILSYIVSFAGCWTALELLQRRTCSKGIYNWFLLIGAATAMGAVAIWCMHYIGNRAILMLNGERELQIEYSSMYTAVSFFLPICVMGLAFYYFNQSETVTIHGTVVGGFTTGLAVCGMHYTGQVGISNYSISYSPKHILGSAIIAVATNTAALGIFFYFTMTWTNGLLKRLGCASLLALSVSGMHWVATVGTFYRFKSDQNTANGLSRQGVVIVVLCLGIGCCLALLSLAVIGKRSKQQYADRAQQVVLACATFDQEGKLMVTPGGLLPCRKITNSYIERSFDEVFDVNHPVFCWVYRASHCWQGVAELLPGIRAHLRPTGVMKLLRPEQGSTSLDIKLLATVDGTEDYSLLFKELFCIAAQELATAIQQPLEKIGGLFDGIVATGTVHKTIQRWGFNKVATRNDLNNNLDEYIEAAEKGKSNVIFGRGQLLFVVRRVDRADSAQMQASGYRFASISNVIDTLARSMEVTAEELLPHLVNLQRYSVEERLLQPGIHLACFALRPLFHRGFEVLVRQEAKNLLPTRVLPWSRIEKSHMELLNQMDNLTVAMCCERLHDQSLGSNEKDVQLAEELLVGITTLAQQIEKPFFQEARLTARPFKVPCQGPSTNHTLDYALIFAFRIVVDAHQYSTINQSFMFAPSRFFLCQQHVYNNSPDHAAFTRRMHRELAALAENIDQIDVQSVSSCPRRSFNPLPYFRLDFFRSEGTSTPSKEKSPLSTRPSLGIGAAEDKCASEKLPVKRNPNSTFGGIHVSNEITIDVIDADLEEICPDFETPKLGVRTEAGVATMESETFADQLMALTIAERRHPRQDREF